jgi:hypothetical protein
MARQLTVAHSQSTLPGLVKSVPVAAVAAAAVVVDTAAVAAVAAAVAVADEIGIN